MSDTEPKRFRTDFLPESDGTDKPLTYSFLEAVEAKDNPGLYRLSEYNGVQVSHRGILADTGKINTLDVVFEKGAAMRELYEGEQTHPNAHSQYRLSAEVFGTAKWQHYSQM